MSLIKKLGQIVFILILTVLVVVGIWAAWERNRDPVAALNIHPGQITVLRDSSYRAEIIAQTRLYRDVLIKTENLGKIQAYVSLPDAPREEQIPVIVILGGLNIGIKNFELIENPGNNAVIIYHYPYSPEYWYDGAAVREIPLIRKSVLSVPAQVLVLIQWVEQQSWAQRQPISVLGYSFGALFLPSVYHLANTNEQILGPGVIAYAGADIYDLLKTNLRKLAQPFKSMFAWTAATAIYPVEPALHLAHMNNEFLIINGTRDHQISEYSWRKLHELMPEPKTVVILDEGHMHPRKPELTMKLVDISERWLLERGLINP